ncbi:hypothetical protein, partial [Cysteiniphilum marinum]
MMKNRNSSRFKKQFSFSFLITLNNMTKYLVISIILFSSSNAVTTVQVGGDGASTSLNTTLGSSDYLTVAANGNDSGGFRVRHDNATGGLYSVDVSLVDGSVRLNGVTTVDNALSVTGNTNMSTLSTSGLATMDSVSVTNNSTIGGTLGVTGTTSTNGITNTGNISTTADMSSATSTVSGDSTVGGTLGVTGTTSTNGITNTGNISTTADMSSATSTVS